MAASLGNENKWRSLSTDLIKKQAKELITQKVSTAKAAPKRESSNDDKVVQNAPAIVDTPRLSLSGGLFNKKPMTVQGSEAVFTGSAKVTDGIVEDLSITLPDGKTISIFALNERMNGNVFTYEDTGTGILKSGLLYEVSGGVMVTLTDDSQYPGLRLEFKTGESIAAQNQEENWELNDQNLEAEDAFENKESEQQEYAQNDYSEEDVYYDEENENTEQVQGEEQQNYGFSF